MRQVVQAALTAMAIALPFPAAAQDQGGSPKSAKGAPVLREQIAAVEAALENAVRRGTQMLDQRLQATTAANWVMLAGLTRARGFHLEGYGIVFDVEFPSMRRSMVWSLRELERAQRTSAGPARALTEAEPVAQPREIYQSEITSALVNAILDYRAPLSVGADEWLTMAARESVVDRRLVPGDPGDHAITVIVRIRGRDLSDLREGNLTSDDARKRVEIRTY